MIAKEIFGIINCTDSEKEFIKQLFLGNLESVPISSRKPFTIEDIDFIEAFTEKEAIEIYYKDLNNKSNLMDAEDDGENLFIFRVFSPNLIRVISGIDVIEEESLIPPKVIKPVSKQSKTKVTKTKK